MKQQIADRITDRITDGVAVGAVTSPFWMGLFMDVSAFFAGLLPIIGTVWISFQLVTHIRNSLREGNKEGNKEGRKELLEEQKDDRDGV